MQGRYPSKDAVALHFGPLNAWPGHPCSADRIKYGACVRVLPTAAWGQVKHVCPAQAHVCHRLYGEAAFG